MAVPNIQNYFYNAWGYPDETDLGSCWGPIGVIVGTNPPYAVSDFLAIYPKFGTLIFSLSAALPNPDSPGDGYSVDDLLTIVQPGGSNGIAQVVAVDSNGIPLGYAIVSIGKGYSTAQGLSTTGGTGTGALIDITTTSAYSGFVPLIVLQMYVALAAASLQQVRYQELWPLVMALYIAHMCTMYLRSEGNVGTTAGQVATSGLEKGILVSKSAGGVSASLQLPQGLESWGMWNETTYGTQLITYAKAIGSMPVYLP